MPTDPDNSTGTPAGERDRVLRTVLADYRRAVDPSRPVLVPPPVVASIPVAGGRVLPLDVHEDGRGWLYECHRESWSATVPGQHADREPVAQVYVSTTRPGVVKGWHLHLDQRDRFVPVAGAAILLLVDLRENTRSPLAAPGLGGGGTVHGACRRSLRLVAERTGRAVAEIILSADRPCRVEVPPGVAHGWIAIGSTPCSILNMPSREYDGTDEYRRGPHLPVADDTRAVEWRDPCDG